MAYLSELKTECDVERCKKPAKVELFNRINVPQGVYCVKHGKLYLAAMQKHETEMLACRDRK